MSTQLASTPDAIRALKVVRRCGTGGGSLSLSLHADMWSMVDNVARNHRLSRQDVIRAALLVLMDLLNQAPTSHATTTPAPTP